MFFGDNCRSAVQGSGAGAQTAPCFIAVANGLGSFNSSFPHYKNNNVLYHQSSRPIIFDIYLSKVQITEICHGLPAFIINVFRQITARSHCILISVAKLQKSFCDSFDQAPPTRKINALYLNVIRSRKKFPEIKMAD